MRSAIYYPHTEIRSESMLKTALLLWDQVRVIVPWENYQTTYINPVAREAFEVIGDPHYPTLEERTKAHKLVEDFATTRLPAAFTYGIPGVYENYEVYPQKLLPETWQVLQDADLVSKHPLPNADYSATRATGLSLMSLLADCCGGETFTRATDQGAAYATVASLITQDQATPPEPTGIRAFLDRFRLSEARDQLVALSLDTIDTRALTLERLLALRKEEAARGGHALRDLRHRLARHIDDQAQSLLQSTSQTDLDERKRQFRSDITDDYADLREALQLEATQVIATKEIVASVAAPIGWALAFGIGLHVPEAITAAGAAVSIGGLIAAKSKFARTRKKLLTEHPTAYLYEAQGGLRL